jgi:hypothetical protein
VIFASAFTHPTVIPLREGIPARRGCGVAATVTWRTVSRHVELSVVSYQLSVFGWRETFAIPHVLVPSLKNND